MKQGVKMLVLNRRGCCACTPVQPGAGVEALEHLVETSASCTPNINKLSTKNLHCFYTATVTEKDVTVTVL